MRLGRNLVAGMGNSAWTALVGLVATPFYLHYLGVEAYGLVGVFLTLQAMLSLLDLGLSPTMNRETARGIADGPLDGVRALLHSFAFVSWTVALCLGVLLALAAPTIARHWLKAEQLTVGELGTALVLMGAAVACRWPAGLYQGTLYGAQRLVVSSAISSGYATLSAGGAIAVLAWCSPTIAAFFAWQALAALAYTLALRMAAWRALGGRRGARAGMAPLRRVWRFSAGMGLIAVSSLIFTQVDKMLLSTLLPLEAFARYTLAGLLSGGLYVLVTPMFNVMFPRFSALVAAGEADRLGELYSLGTRVLATLVFPTAMVLAFFARPLLELWTGNAGLAAAAAPVVVLLTAGTALHAVMYFPYALQLAYGVPRLTMTINVVMIALLVPLMVALTLTYGEIGAAGAWLSLHIFYLLFGTWMTHRRLLPGRAGRWLVRDVGLPLAASIAVAAIGAAAGAHAATSHAGRAAWAIAMWSAPVLLSLAAFPGLRRSLLDNIGLASSAYPRSDP
jgi:O-antigen/teichoic acid export membrane protein